MKKKLAYLFICFVLINSFSIYSQLTVSIQTTPSPLPSNGDTTNVCTDSLILFKAEASYTNGNNFDPTTTKFRWRFGDNSQQSGDNLETVTHSYSDGGGYFVSLTIIDEYGEKAFASKPIRVGLIPNFEGTEASLESSCLGEEFQLTGSITNKWWEYTFNKIAQPQYPAEVSQNFTAHINYANEAFNKNQLITQATDILQVCLTIEHAYLNRLTIKLHNLNNTLVLHQSGGSEAMLGEPINNNTYSMGTGYRYCWAENSDNGTMNSQAQGSETTLPAGTYTTHESFDAFVGTRLNSDWEIEVIDNGSTDFGYAYSAEFYFNPEIYPQNWKFSNNYALASEVWTGDSIVEINNLSARAKTKKYDANLYKFRVIDNFGCPHDTSLRIDAVKPNFKIKMNSEESDAGAIPALTEVSSETQWVKLFTWNFGDGSASVQENTGTASYTYNENSYTGDSISITLKAESENQCIDTKLKKIWLTLPESAIELKNVFTPNGDNVNDVFKIEEEFTKKFRKLEAKIYSRYGMTVCTWKSPQEATAGWDGSIGNDGGMKATPGVYFIVVYAVGLDGKEHNLTATIHLFR